MNRYSGEAFLAALDGRDNDVGVAITNLIDKGGRWQGFLQPPAFDHLKDGTRFQAQVSRMADQVITDRGEILIMLCGPESILTSWQPAPATCEIYHQETATVKS